MRRSEGGKPLLSLGLRVGPDSTAKDAMAEHDQRSVERLGVEEVGEGDGGQVTAVPDEEWFGGVDELGLDLGHAVLVGEG